MSANSQFFSIFNYDLPFESDQLNYTILSVNDGVALDVAFHFMKQEQKMDRLDATSCIFYNNVIIPAGYFDTFEQMFGVYYNILYGNENDIISFLPSTLDKKVVKNILTHCKNEKIRIRGESNNGIIYHKNK